ncbi:sulfopyruvate decarboxylase subunit beta [Catenulispora sp. GAS73]|uniref:thiamine pyrophosphate-dependent enzyme n=1 Tax=Catenulispora sp. GAS73 TaxID=3156269 RepID=UPI0035138F8C
MNKTTAVAAVIEAFPEAPIVFTTGYTCRIARHLRDSPNHFYMVGSMGLAPSIAVGIALQTGKPAVVVDGDGSLMMNPVGLLIAGPIRDLPLLHVLLDDGVYDSTGGQPTPSAGVDFGAWARGSGFDEALRADDEHALCTALARHADVSSPTFLHCRVDADAGAPPPRVDADLADHADRLRRHVSGLVG